MVKETPNGSALVLGLRMTNQLPVISGSARITSHLALSRWLLGLAIAGITAAAHGASGGAMEKAVSAIYQPFRVEQAALSPDGSRVAFVVRQGSSMEVHLFAVGAPMTKKRVSLAARATAQLQLLAWTSPDRLVVAFDQPLIAAIDARLGAVTTLLTAATFSQQDISRRTVRVLGLPADDPDALMLETVGYTDEGELEIEVLRLNLQNGLRQSIQVTQADPPGGMMLVDQQGAPRIFYSEEDVPHRFNYRPARGSARWKSLDRLDGDARDLAFHVTPQNFLGARSIPLGFDYDPEILYFASNVGRDTFGIYALDLRTGRRTPFAVEDAEFDLAELGLGTGPSPLVFDRARRSLVGIRRVGLETGTRWLDSDLAATQATLEKKFPGRHVQILGWDHPRQRFLALVDSQAEPGRYFVFHREGGRIVQYLQRASGLTPENINPSESFSFAAPGGTRVSGYLTTPHASPVAKPPLLIWLHDGPWQRNAPGYNREPQALAAMGFMVAQIDYAGSGGRGRQARESIRQRIDTAPLADVLATVAWLETRQGFDRRRVALVGEGFGGYLGLRALELHPDVFRCVVSINAPVELSDFRRSLALEEATRRKIEQEMLNAITSPAMTLEQREAAMARRVEEAVNAPIPPVDFEHELFNWFYGGTSALAETSVLKHSSAITKPVLLLHEPRHAYAPIASVKALRDALTGRKVPVGFAEISPQFGRGVLSARAQVIRRVGEFLNVTLYDFDVKIGEAKETK